MGQGAPSTLAGIRTLKEDFGGQTLVKLEKDMPFVYKLIDSLFSLATIVLAGFVISSLAWLKNYYKRRMTFVGGAELFGMQAPNGTNFSVSPSPTNQLPRINFEFDQLINMAIAFFAMVMGKNTNDLVNQTGDLFKSMDPNTTIFQIAYDSQEVTSVGDNNSAEPLAKEKTD
jgi:hypothetical protein